VFFVVRRSRDRKVRVTAGDIFASWPGIGAGQTHVPTRSKVASSQPDTVLSGPKFLCNNRLPKTSTLRAVDVGSGAESAGRQHGPGRTLLLWSAPDFSEANRKDTREAILFTTTVDVPHAGLP
jgi:hypothetical protein